MSNNWFKKKNLPLCLHYNCVRRFWKKVPTFLVVHRPTRWGCSSYWWWGELHCCLWWEPKGFSWEWWTLKTGTCSFHHCPPRIWQSGTCPIHHCPLRICHDAEQCMYLPSIHLQSLPPQCNFNGHFPLSLSATPTLNFNHLNYYQKTTPSFLVIFSA